MSEDPRDPGEPPDSTAQLPPSQSQPGPYDQHWGGGPVGAGAETDTGRKTGLFLLLGGGVVLIILVGFLAYSLLGNKGGGTDSPAHAVQAFGNAIGDRDCPAAQDVMTDKAAQSFSCDQIDLASLPDIQVSLDNIRVTEQSDSTATVKADLTALGQSIGMTFSMLNQHGDWLIDNVAVQAGGLTGDMSGG
jgi:hypothetical protein